MEDQQNNALDTLIFTGTKLFNLNEDEFKKIILDDDGNIRNNAGDLILDKDKARVDKWKSDRDDAYNKGHQKATKEALTSAETKFKEITGWEGNGEEGFDDMVKAFLEDQAKKSKKPTLSDDDVKKHPLYLELEKSRIPKEEYEKIKGEYEDFKKNTSRNQILQGIKSKAWGIVSQKNPILSENQAVAENRRNDFLAKFGGYDYQEQDDGTIIVLKEGKRLEDDHGNPQQFENFVMGLASLNFDFKKQSDKGGAGGDDDDDTGTSVTEKPTTQDQLNAVLEKYNDNTDEHRKIRVSALAYYEKNKTD